MHVQLQEFINIVKQQQQTINALSAKLSEVMTMLQSVVKPNQDQTLSGRGSGSGGGGGRTAAINSAWSQPWAQHHHFPTDSDSENV